MMKFAVSAPSSWAALSLKKVSYTEFELVTPGKKTPKMAEKQ